jgi:hypothetical protein
VCDFSLQATELTSRQRTHAWFATRLDSFSANKPERWSRHAAEAAIARLLHATSRLGALHLI